MWRPQSWEEVKALEGHAEETQTLDFKKELGKSHEIAKDLAALALGGGVLIYGADEDKESATITCAARSAFCATRGREASAIG